MDKKKKNEEVVKEAVEEAKKAAEKEVTENDADTAKEVKEECSEAEKECSKNAECDDSKAPKKDKKDEQIADLTDKLTRQMAEFDNYRKRTEKEKSAMYEIGAKDVIEKILPIVDNFERGFATVAEEEKENPFVQGMDKVYKQMLTELDAAGVKPIECVGQEFDPDFHNAVMQVENDELESGTVAQELQKGYMYKDSVVRHSMVSVVQ
mgnify:CR=1 FL=1